MQALPFNSSGTEASSESVNVIDLHQHSTSKDPAADAAHSLGLPQIGQSGA